MDVSGVADTPGLSVGDSVEGGQGEEIPLDIASSLSDTDGSESLQITVSGLPAGLSLSAGVENADGTWTLSPDELEGLTLNPTPGAVGRFQLEVVATATDGSSVATSHASIDVDIYPVESDSEEIDGSEDVENEPPSEIDWGDEQDLGFITSGPGIDDTIDEIDENLTKIAYEAPEMADKVSQMGEELIGEVMPIISEAADSEAPVPPPDEPLFEFVRAENADHAEGDASQMHGTQVNGVVQGAEQTQSEKSSTTERIASTFTVLWGLVRSLGARDNNDEKQTSDHASRGRRR